MEVCGIYLGAKGVMWETLWALSICKICTWPLRDCGVQAFGLGIEEDLGLNLKSEALKTA